MTARKGRGRPPFLWHGPKGKEFVIAVYLSQYYEDFKPERGALNERRRRRISRAQAIRIVLQKPGFEALKKYAPNGSTRDLEKRLIAANEYWNPYARLGKEWRNTKRFTV